MRLVLIRRPLCTVRLDKRGVVRVKRARPSLTLRLRRVRPNVTEEDTDGQIV